MRKEYKKIKHILKCFSYILSIALERVFINIFIDFLHIFCKEKTPDAARKKAFAMIL